MMLRVTLCVAILLLLGACSDGGSPFRLSQQNDTGKVSEPGMHGSVSQDFLTLPDGTQLYYTLTMPKGDGPFPVLLQYDPYAAGVTSDPTWNEAGYAMLGVNMRGTGCSQGTFKPLRTDIWGQDGADVVAWVAEQPWSTGDVGMFGYSFTGVAQIGTAAFAGPELRAIAPGNIFLDFYRDFIYPGGILNQWVPGWILAARGFVVGQQAAQQIFTDPQRCGPSHIQQLPGNSTEVVEPVLHSWSDDAVWADQPSAYLDHVTQPALVCVNWQDTTIYSRSMNDVIEGLSPDSTWIVGSNGAHADCAISRARMLRFFDHYLKGKDNGWTSTPHMTLVHEVDNDQGTGVRETLSDNAGAWQTSFAQIADVEKALTTLSLYLHADSRLLGRSPDGESAPSQFIDAPTTANTPADFAGIDSFGNPRPPGTSVSFTTPALEQDLVLFGSAAAEIWLSTLGVDADIQVLISEVRPDGQEVYVQNGWLRWSRRAEDESESRERRPFHLHTQESESMLTPGEIALGRIEIYPFNHVFRMGSAIRLTLDTPAGWFEQRPQGVAIQIHHDEEHSSVLKLGWLPGQHSHAPMPDCGVLLNQPCREDSEGIPDGTLSLQ